MKAQLVIEPGACLPFQAAADDLQMARSATSISKPLAGCSRARYSGVI